MYFHLVPNAPNFFDFNYLPTLFTVLKIYNVILCQLFFQQIGAVKTLPQHNPLILSFFTDSNEFPIRIVHTNRISFIQ